ncbi:MAG: response regulator [Actinomycetota bacterium]
MLGSVASTEPPSPADPSADRPRLTGVAGNEGGAARADSPLVLVVDDEPDIRDLIRLNLEAEGYRVATAVDGDDAIVVARHERPDAMFLDVLMPGLDGWDVLARLKAGDPDLVDVPVIMVTALSQSEDRLRAAIEGALRYLSKPFHPRELVATLDEILSPHTPTEPELRRQARQDALESLARLEAGRDASDSGPRVRLTRLEQPPVADAVPNRVTSAQDAMTQLSAKQRELLRLVQSEGSVTIVAQRLGTGRSNVYASLRRVATRLGLRDTTELLRLLTNSQLEP